MEYIYIVFMGIGVSLLSTILGLGGGILVVPLLPLVLDTSHLSAMATSLLVIFFVTLFNTYRFQKKKMIKWSTVRSVAPSAIVVAFLCAYIASHLTSPVLMTIFLILVFLILISLLRSKPVLNINELTKVNMWKKLLVGTTTGTISGFTGVGGGSIAVPMLISLKLASHKQVVPTTNAIMVFISFSALTSFIFSHQQQYIQLIKFKVALIIFICHLLIFPVGAKLNSQITFKTRKVLLSLMLVLIIIRYVYRLWF